MLSIRRLWLFFVDLFNTHKQGKQLQIKILEESPELHENSVIYLIGDNDNYWFAEMACPCKCGEIIKLKLFGNSPAWSATIHKNNLITLSPSVWRTIGCRSHFFVKHSHIHWAKDFSE